MNASVGDMELVRKLIRELGDGVYPTLRQILSLNWAAKTLLRESPDAEVPELEQKARIANLIELGEQNAKVVIDALCSGTMLAENREQQEHLRHIMKRLSKKLDIGGLAMAPDKSSG